MAEIKETVIIEAKTEGEDDVKKLSKAINDSKDATEKQTKASEELSKQNKKTAKEGKQGFEKLNGAVKSVGKGFNILGGAMKAAGIGLVVGLIVKLTHAFSQNQQIMDAVNRIFTSINIVFQAVTDSIINAFNSVSKATGGFDALGKVMSGLLTLALTPIKVSFFAIKLALQQAQLAWEQSFFGDEDPKTIKRLNEEIKQTKTDLLEVGASAVNAGKDIVNNFSEAFDEVSSFTTTAIDNIKQVSVTASIETANKLVEARKASELAEAQLQGLIEKYDREAELLRQQRDDIRLTIDERIKANDELNKVLETQLAQQLKLANQRVKSAQLEIQATGDNIANQRALIEAKNEVLAVEAQITGFQSEQRVNEASLQEERRANLAELKQIGLSEAELRKQELEDEFEERKLLIERTISGEKEKNEFILKARKELTDGINALNKVEEKSNEKLEEKKKQNALDGIATIANAVGLGKEFSIASALINTYEGITSALKLPFPSNIIASIATGATGFKAVSDIVNTPVPSVPGGGGSASSSSAPSAPPQPPAFNLVGQANTSAITQPITQTEERPVQAFVVSRNVTTAQMADRNAESASTF